MSNRITISSDHVDKHGDRMTKEALISGAEIINSDRSVKWTIEHKRDIPPLGKIEDAKVEEQDGHYYLTAKELKFDIYKELPWDNNLIKASSSSNDKPFTEPALIIPENLTLSVDSNIFKSRSDYKNYLKAIEELDLKIETGDYGRKAFINDPEIIIELAEYYFLYKLLKPTVEQTLKKTSDKISDKLSDEAVKFYDLIRKSITELVLRIKPRNRPISYVIQVPGTPEIELFARIAKSEELIKALKPRQIEKVVKKMTELSENVRIEKAQFILENGKWKFNYLLTDKGDAIGTKKSFKKRDRKLEYTRKLIDNKN